MKSNVHRLIPFILCLCFLVCAGGAWAAGPAAVPKTKTVKLDLNRATARELTALPGVGAKKAEAILEYRRQKGPFASTEDLLRVKGIGRKLLDRIAPMITVENRNPDLPKTSR